MPTDDIQEKDPNFGEDYQGISDRVENNVHGETTGTIKAYDDPIKDAVDDVGADTLLDARPEPGYGLAMSSSVSPRRITIQPQSVGYLLEIGCQTGAIETPEKLIKILTRYLTDPAGTENDFFNAKQEDRLKMFD